jgi:Family of unknown function (DUF6527)
MRRASISHQLVEFIPEHLEEGVLYISERYGTAAHKCCCGCGEEVITPLTPTDWSVRMDGKVVTMQPSIGNWSYACRSHYLIQKSDVVWAGNMSQQQIERGRARDRAAKKAHFEAVNLGKGLPSSLPSNEHHSDIETSRGLSGLWLTLKRWWTFN